MREVSLKLNIRYARYPPDLSTLRSANPSGLCAATHGFEDTYCHSWSSIDNHFVVMIIDILSHMLLERNAFLHYNDHLWFAKDIENMACTSPRFSLGHVLCENTATFHNVCGVGVEAKVGF